MRLLLHLLTVAVRECLVVGLEDEKVAVLPLLLLEVSDVSPHLQLAIRGLGQDPPIIEMRSSRSFDLVLVLNDKRWWALDLSCVIQVLALVMSDDRLPNVHMSWRGAAAALVWEQMQWFTMSHMNKSRRTMHSRF